jgi:epoxyqueuosine reductase
MTPSPEAAAARIAQGATAQPMDPSILSSRIRDQAVRMGFDAAGITELRPSDHARFYRAWLDAGYHGEMHYLSRTDAVAKRIDARAAWPGLRSAVVLAQNYAASADPPDDDASRGDIARYARGRDYHRVLKPRLLELLHCIESFCDRELPLARAYVDTGPVFERELARRAGLGWFGRNTMLIHPRRGSYFFLAILLLEIDLEPDAGFESDHCGRCRACLDACPTGALLGRNSDGAPMMDARRCISYLTIEHRGPIPRELRPLIGNHIFGCDICQEVCPWNYRSSAKLPSRASRAPGDAKDLGAFTRPALPVIPELGIRAADAPQLLGLMRMTPEAWEDFSRGRAVRRAGYVGFRRNVAVALGNWASPDAAPVLITALSEPAALIRGHAAWALGRVKTPEAAAALTRQLAAETDPWVSEEIASALSA